MSLPRSAMVLGGRGKVIDPSAKPTRAEYAIVVVGGHLDLSTIPIALRARMFGRSLTTVSAEVFGGRWSVE